MWLHYLIFLVIGLAAGATVAWLATRLRKGAGPDPRVENELRQQLARQENELTQTRLDLSGAVQSRAAAGARLAAVEETMATLRQELETAAAAQASQRQELLRTAEARATAEARLAAAERLLAEEKEGHALNLIAAREAQEKALADLREAFRALSADALKQTQPEFLRLAGETLARFQESAKGDLAQRQQAIATLVEPLKQQLQTYQQRLQQSETAQAVALGEVKKHLETLNVQSQSLSSETLQLRRVLSSNQARGRWGEETLRRVVEAAGLSAHCDFTEQAQSDDKKPDLQVHLPGNRLILVDAKVPSLEFLGALDEADQVKRKEALAAHAARLRSTIKDLADRDYPGQFSNALDHVVLFLPAESLFSAALEGDRDLIVWAAARRILLATPASLIALLRSVSVSWQQYAQTENARAIADAAREFYTRVARFTEHFEKIREGLLAAGRAYDAAVGSYERSVRPSGQRLGHLGGGAPGKELPEIGPLDAPLRLPPTTESGDIFGA
jgi:DNA recombination protein RmuC